MITIFKIAVVALLVVVLLAICAVIATLVGAFLATFSEDSDPYGNDSNTDTKGTSFSWLHEKVIILDYALDIKRRKFNELGVSIRLRG